MLFDQIDFSKFTPEKQLCLYHTARWPAIKGRNWNGDKQETYFNCDKGGICSDSENSKPCEVFNDYLIYLFYGRPAFRWESKEQFPIFFVFAPDNKINPCKIFPFDSGAFHRGLYNKMKKYLSMELKDYQLSDEGEGLRKETIPRLINALWDNNENYFDGIPGRKLLDSESLSLQEKEYLNFVYNGHDEKWANGSADSRAFTIEYIVRHILPLSDLIRVFAVQALGDTEIGELETMLQKACGHYVFVETLDVPPTEAFNEMFKKAKSFMVGGVDS